MPDIAAPYSLSPSAVVANAAPAPTLKDVITDADLDHGLQLAGLHVTDPAAREHLRASLFEGAKFVAMEPDDERFIAHAEHMNMNGSAFAQRAQQLREQGKEINQQAQGLLGRVQSAQQGIRSAMTGSVIAGVIAGAGAVFLSVTKLKDRIPTSWKRWVAGLGIGAVTNLAVSFVVAKLTTNGKLQELQQMGPELDALKQQNALLGQATKEQIQGFKDQFIAIHLQRSYADYQKTHGATSVLSDPTAAHNQVTQPPRTADMQPADAGHSEVSNPKDAFGNPAPTPYPSVQRISSSAEAGTEQKQWATSGPRSLTERTTAPNESHAAAQMQQAALGSQLER